MGRVGEESGQRNPGICDSACAGYIMDKTGPGAIRVGRRGSQGASRMATAVS